MEELFMEVVSLSFIGSLVIGFVLLLRLFMKRLPKKFSYILWLIPGIRLLCPISFRGIWGVWGNIEMDFGDRMVVLPMKKEIAEAIGQPDFIWGQMGVSVSEGRGTPESQMELVVKVCSILWVVGVVWLVFYNIVSYIKLYRRIRVSIKLREHIYLADSIASPFVIGIFPARIYLPSGVNWGDYPDIIAHEEIHRKRYDHLFKLLAYGIVMIHWFNPIVWIGFFFFVRDMEMSCDEAVMGKEPREIRQRYAHALLDFAIGKKFEGFPVSFSEGNAKGRIKNLMREKKKSKWITLLAGVIVFVAAVLLIPNFGESDADISKEAVEAVNSTSPDTIKRTGEWKEDMEGVSNQEYGYPTEQFSYSYDENTVTVNTTLNGKIPVKFVIKEKIQKDNKEDFIVDDATDVIGERLEELKSAVQYIVLAFQEEYPDLEDSERNFTIKQIVYDEEKSEELLKKYGEKEGIVMQMDVDLPELAFLDSSWRYFDFSESNVKNWSWIAKKDNQGKWKVKNCKDGIGMK